MRRSVTRFLVGLVAASTCAAVLPVLTAAAAPGLTLSATTVAAAPDFATQRYADPWDFSNGEDLSLEPLKAGNGLTNPGYVNGRYETSIAARGWINLVQTVQGQLPYGRDGQAIPISADQYTRLSVRMWSDKNDTAQIWWSRCPEANTACFGASQFQVYAGWGIYDIRLAKLASTSADWTGSMLSIRIDPLAVYGGGVSLDWVRLYQPVAANQITLTGAPSAQVLIDQDTNPGNGNETILRRDDATLRTDPYGRTVLDSSLLPPGSWWLATRSSAGVSYAASPLTVTGPPMPVVIDPDVSGGADVHQVLGTNSWDFAQASDVSSTYSVAGGVAGGVFNGRNASPEPGDNQLNLSMPAAMDGSRFHRLTFKVSYDGPWGLQDTPGGGMVARLIWNVAGSSDAQISNDIIVMPGSQTVSLDLSDNSGLVLDETVRNRIGWAGRTITSLRFDPNEDPSTARSWQLDDVRLAQDDQGDGSFSVQFKDANWAPGTVADIYVDRGARGQNRTPIVGGLPVTQGVNSYRWNLGGLPEGTYWVLVGMRRGDVSASAFSTGPVQMKTSAPQPFGRIDSVAQVGSDGVRVQGWAVDPALGGAAGPVHVYVDGRGAALTASNARPDVGAAFGLGSNHGFDYTMTGIGPGSHRVCAYAYRAVGSVTLGCQAMTVSADPIGRMDSVSGVTGGVQIAGWSLDPSTAASNLVHVYVDNRVAVAARASLDRPDIAAAFPGYGANHGFSVPVPIPSGTHSVCAYGIDQLAPGGNPQLGCRTVSVSNSPFGAVDVLSRSGNSVSIAGWVIDPRRANGTATHVYVDGVGAAILGVTGNRADVNAAYPGYASPTTAYAATINVSAGSHRVCVYGVGAESASTLGCQTV